MGDVEISFETIFLIQNRVFLKHATEHAVEYNFVKECLEVLGNFSLSNEETKKISIKEVTIVAFLFHDTLQLFTIVCD